MTRIPILRRYLTDKLAASLLVNIENLNSPSAPATFCVPDTGEMTIYVHFPFCDTACRHCPFSKTVNKSKMEQYCRALLTEIDLMVDQHHLDGRTITSVYFGGGTPSLIPLPYLRKIIDKFRERFELKSGVQITLESNPSSIDLCDLTELQEIGVNRLSIGVQSMDESVLAEMGRKQDPAGTRALLQGLANRGFSNFNVDLMYGFDCQTTPMFLRGIAESAKFGAAHISVFPLTVGGRKERPRSRTRRREKKQRGMYKEACALAEELGYSQYSTEDFSRGQSSRNEYQLDCWQVPAKGMLLFGTSAFGALGNCFYFKQPRLEAYLNSVGRGELPLCRVASSSGDEFFVRKLMVALHFLTVDSGAFETNYGPGSLKSASKMTKLLGRLGLLSTHDDNISLTGEGRFFYSKLWTNLMQHQYSNLG